VFRGLSREFWIGTGLAIIAVGIGIILAVISMPDWLRVTLAVFGGLLVLSGLATMVYFGLIQPSAQLHEVKGRGLILDIHAQPYSLPVLRSRRIHAIKWIAVLLLAVGVAGVWAWDSRKNLATRENSAVLPSPSPSVDYYPTPLTLRELFDTDFGLNSITNDFTIANPATGQIAKGSLREFYDFTANSTFLSIYMGSSPNALFALEVLPSKIPSMLAELSQRFKIGSRIPGDTADTISPNMRFSGQLYVYYENDFGLDQLDEIEKQFKAAGYFVQLWGQYYLASHWNDKRQRLKLFCPPGAKLNARNVCEPSR
jgi:hypothetical protein